VLCQRLQRLANARILAPAKNGNFIEFRAHVGIVADP
jgi:hypothetical protein